MCDGPGMRVPARPASSTDWGLVCPRGKVSEPDEVYRTIGREVSQNFSAAGIAIPRGGAARTGDRCRRAEAHVPETGTPSFPPQGKKNGVALSRALLLSNSGSYGLMVYVTLS